MESLENIFVNGEELPTDAFQQTSKDANNPVTQKRKGGRPRKLKPPKGPPKKIGRPKKKIMEALPPKPQTHVCEWINGENQRKKRSNEEFPKLFESKNNIFFTLCNECLTRLSKNDNRFIPQDDLCNVNFSLCKSCVGGNVCMNKTNYKLFIG